jgi:hypothetical protein
MKDAYELLQQKQTELGRVRKEIESLNIVAPLLSDDRTSDDPAPNPDESPPSSLNDTISRLSDSAATNADNLFSSVATSRSGFWRALKRAR